MIGSRHFLGVSRVFLLASRLLARDSNRLGDVIQAAIAIPTLSSFTLESKIDIVSRIFVL